MTQEKYRAILMKTLDRKQNYIKTSYNMILLNKWNSARFLILTSLSSIILKTISIKFGPLIQLNNNKKIIILIYTKITI